jgi:hypothetical protein
VEYFSRQAHPHHPAQSALLAICQQALASGGRTIDNVLITINPDGLSGRSARTDFSYGYTFS